MHDFHDSAMRFWLQVKNGARYSAILLLIGIIVGINLGFALNVAKKVTGKNDTCCPCFTDKELERQAFLMQLAIQEAVAKYGTTRAADTAEARDSVSSVKDTAQH